MEKTLAIIKPDAVKNKNIGEIINHIEKKAFNILGLEMLRLTKEQAEAFYAIHKERPFFEELVTFMVSGPVVVAVLEKENAIEAWRDVMGATNPAEAKENTLRKLYGSSIGNNAVHGSDSLENAKQEVAFFFPEFS